MTCSPLNWTRRGCSRRRTTSVTKAICDYVDAVKIAKEKVKLGKLKQFKMSFRSKKDPQQSFGVRNRLYERVGPSEFSFLRGSFKNAKVDATIRAREPLPEKIDYDAGLVRTRLGEWYLCIPQLEEQELVAALGDDSQVPSPAVKRVCSLDPGVVCEPSRRSTTQPLVQ